MLLVMQQEKHLPESSHFHEQQHKLDAMEWEEPGFKIQTLGHILQNSLSLCIFTNMKQSF